MFSRPSTVRNDWSVIWLRCLLIAALVLGGLAVQPARAKAEERVDTAVLI